MFYFMNGLVFQFKNKACMPFYTLPAHFEVNFALVYKLFGADQRQIKLSLSQIVGILILSMQNIRIETNSAFI